MKDKPGLYRPDTYRECLDRIGRLTAGTKPAWGTMTSAQMLAHCAEVQEVMNGKELRGTPFMVKLFRGFVRRIVVGEKAYSHNMATHPQYRMTGHHDFDKERARLLQALLAFVEAGESGAPLPRHPLFGELTRDEKGWSAYKHLDHHLRQFGV